MAKSDKDHAVQLWAMASKDHQALAHMQDTESFAEEIFGFHAQQVIEKGLKAWIAVRHLTFPKSHDVSVLVRILEKAGEDLISVNSRIWKITRSSRYSIDTRLMTTRKSGCRETA
jgi:HEPN domain-containing protein